MPTTTNILLNIPTHGSFVDTWDVPNNGDWTSADGFLGGVQGINVAGASPVTLTAPAGTPTPAGGPTQAENSALKFTGLLTGGVTVTLPLPGPMIIHNLTTGSFRLFFRAVGSGQIIAVDQGSVQRIYNDGTNVYFVDLPPVGSYLDVCDSTVPGWIAGCTVPPYLNCDGSSFSAVTYPYLAGKLGSTTLPDLRGVARYSLNQGTGRLTAAGGLDGDTRFSIKTTQTVTLSTLNLPAYTPSGTVASTFTGAAAQTTSGSGGGGILASSNLAPGGGPNFFPGGTVASNFTGAAQGGISQAFGIIGTGTVGGITLIRAA